MRASPAIARLAIVATIPIGLGWLLLMPTMVCATYVAYREIFLA